MSASRWLMRGAIVLCAAALLPSWSALADAAELPRIELATGQIVGDYEPRRPGYGLVAELHSGLSIPGSDIGSADASLRAGATVMWRTTREVAIGVDASLHSWLMSDRFKARYDQDLRNTLLQTVKLGEGPWRMSAKSVTGIIRVSLPERGPVRPWVRFGGGFYRVDPRLQGYTGDAGTFYVSLPVPQPVSVNGVCAGVGLELATSHHLRLGIETNLDYLFGGQKMGRDIRAGSASLSLGWAQR